MAADSTSSFGETEASRGALGTLMGVEIVPNPVGLMRG